MSIRFIDPTGPLARVSEDLGVSQAVSIPASARIVITSGQCGFRDDLSISQNLDEQIAQLLRNAETVLHAAGVEAGLKSVYQVTIYALEMTDELVTEWKKAKITYMGGIQPVETGVTVPALYGGAKVEMSFQAIAGLDGKL